eukprot:TRINITY_DN11779_c0_g2_i2.p1 TRINITY_DN11779_c0_g2~~TRINITY_DN11779_c0_g2_i2.p1  ORF type:complete len:263 (+),score=34.22 TRINITY_DN11779_c0_g2_i2:564-1352(+)
MEQEMSRWQFRNMYARRCKRMQDEYVEYLQLILSRHGIKITTICEFKNQFFVGGANLHQSQVKSLELTERCGQHDFPDAGGPAGTDLQKLGMKDRCMQTKGEKKPRLYSSLEEKLVMKSRRRADHEAAVKRKAARHQDERNNSLERLQGGRYIPKRRGNEIRTLVELACGKESRHGLGVSSGSGVAVRAKASSAEQEAARATIAAQRVEKTKQEGRQRWESLLPRYDAKGRLVVLSVGRCESARQSNSHESLSRGDRRGVAP